MSVKLYELKRGDSFTLADSPKIPPAAPEGRMGVIYQYSHVDGMYAPVKDAEGNQYYFAAWTQVDLFDDE